MYTLNLSLICSSCLQKLLLSYLYKVDFPFSMYIYLLKIYHSKTYYFSNLYIFKKLHHEEFIAFHFIWIFILIYVYGRTYICERAWRWPWRQEEDIGSNLGARVTGAGELPKWVLQRIELWSTSRAAGVFTLWAVSQAPYR